MRATVHIRLSGQLYVIQGHSAKSDRKHNAAEAAAALVRRAGTTRAGTNGENQPDTHTQGRTGTNGHQHAPAHGRSTTRIRQPHPGDRSSAGRLGRSGANAAQVSAVACVLTCIHLVVRYFIVILALHLLFSLNSQYPSAR